MVVAATGDAKESHKRGKSLAAASAQSPSPRSARERDATGTSTTPSPPSHRTPWSEEPEDCPRFVLAAPTARHRIANAELVEASGLVASRRNAGVFFSHNDSGGSARIFAFTALGADLGSFTLDKAKLVDWEDLAIGPGPEPGKSYLYIGDLGQNGGRRSVVSVYRIEEPRVSVSSKPPPAPRRVSSVERLDLTYPKSMGDDSEALFVDPRTADVYVLTKARRGPTRVFRASAPLSKEHPNPLALVTELEGLGQHSIASLVTGASISEDGAQILIRTYFQAYLFRRTREESVAEALQRSPCRIPLQLEPQGEAIASVPGGGYVTVSEGKHPYLHAFEPVK
jgi:hypothetical protein